jgi:exo-1,4-beta-D-glucosaminidase
MREVFRRTAPVTIAADAVTNNVMPITFPADVSPVHFIKLELADAQGQPVSSTFYWRSTQPYERGRTLTGPEYEGFEDLSKLPSVKLNSKVKWSRDGEGNVCEVTVKNPSQSLAFMIWLRLQKAADGKPVRPAFYDDNFFSLLPGESRTIKIRFEDKAANPKEVQLLMDGWNAVRQTFRPGSAL